MSHTYMDRQQRRGVLLQTLLCWTLIGLSCAGPRPYERGERPRYARHHDRWSQRIQFPSPNDQGTQRIEYPSVNDEGAQVVRFPSVHDRGQRVHFPSVNDAASAQIQVNCCRDLLVGGMLRFLPSQHLRCGLSVICRLLSLKAKGVFRLFWVNC